MKNETLYKRFDMNWTASIGALAILLLFATTFATAQDYRPIPFPQAANPALVNAPEHESFLTSMPATMAKPTGSAMVKQETGSPFPSAANPSRHANESDERSLEPRNQQNLASPFPFSARP